MKQNPDTTGHNYSTQHLENAAGIPTVWEVIGKIYMLVEEDK